MLKFSRFVISNRLTTFVAKSDILHDKNFKHTPKINAKIPQR